MATGSGSSTGTAPSDSSAAAPPVSGVQPGPLPPASSAAVLGAQTKEGRADEVKRIKEAEAANENEPETQNAGDFSADFDGKAVGAQKEPATAPAQDAKRGRSTFDFLSEEDLAELSGADIRSIAATRGYQMPVTGTTGSRQSFLRLQAEDKFVTRSSRR